MRALLMVAVAAAVSGCEKAPPAETPPAASAPVATPVTPVDSTIQVKADSSPKTAAPKAEGPLRDSVIEPKFTVDEKGKVTPIKKP
ncbi:MAG: hypothetical protein P3A28_02685 [Gemmatimonadota bacterium]|nr:hypothetical protein [Gemmatimonadota bacterium]